MACHDCVQIWEVIDLFIANLLSSESGILHGRLDLLPQLLLGGQILFLGEPVEGKALGTSEMAQEVEHRKDQRSTDSEGQTYLNPVAVVSWPATTKVLEDDNGVTVKSLRLNYLGMNASRHLAHDLFVRQAPLFFLDDIGLDFNQAGV